MSLHIKKGDKVFVLSGKDKGKVGEVLKSYPKLGKVVVDGVNLKSKHMKSEGDQKGKIVRAPYPIHATKVIYYSEEHKAPTRLGRKVLEDGKKVRFMKKFKETV